MMENGNLLKEKEVIPLKSGKDTTIVVRTSVHDLVISDIHPLLMDMSWTGHWITKKWMRDMTTMKNWSDFSSAIKNFGVPGQNIVYADVEGKHRVEAGGLCSNTEKEGYSLIPRPGYLKGYDWAGKSIWGKMPDLYNPSGVYSYSQ